MIPLTSIEVKESKDSMNGATHFDAKLVLRASARIGYNTMQSTEDLAGLKNHIREDLSKRIWHMVYGDLTDDIFQLIMHVRRTADPSQDQTEIMRLTMALEAKLK